MNKNMMKKIIKRTLQIAVPLLFGIAVMYWVYRDFDFGTAAYVLVHEMNWWWMAVSLVFGVLSHVLRGWRWVQTLEPLGAFPRVSNCVNAIFLSYAANLVIPRLGEVSRCGVLSRYDKISFAKSLGTVVTERLIDTLSVCLITAVAILGQTRVFTRFFAGTGTDFSSLYHIFTDSRFYIILLCTIATGILLYRLMRVLSFFERIRGVAVNVWAGVTSLRDVRRKGRFVLLTVGIWFCYFMQFYVTFFCFDFTAGLSVWAGLVMFVAGSIAVVVPTPNGAGPWHFAIIAMMGLYGVDAVNAGIFALIVHGIQTFLVIVLGVYASLALPMTNRAVQPSAQKD